jgi:hypothetical protein
MFSLTSWRTQRLVMLLDRTPAWRWTLEELFHEQGWEVIHDSAQPTGYVVVDAGWGWEQGRGLVLYLDDAELVMLTGALGRVEDNRLRGELAPAWVTASQRYGSLRQAGGGAMWDTGTGELLIAPELGMATAVWVRHGYLADPAQRGTAGLSMRMLEKLVTNEATGSDWPDAVARATQLVPDDVGTLDRWEVVASVAIGVQVLATEQGITSSQVRDADVVEHVAAVLAAAQRPRPDQPQ